MDDIAANAAPVTSNAGHMQSLAAEEQARADFYALLAALLLHAPPPALLAALIAAPAMPSLPFVTSVTSVTSDEAISGLTMATAWHELADAARRLGAAAVHEEFNALFVSVGTPLLNPYGSRYLAGFIMEKPLAALRDDLRELGLSRTAGCAELEDHLGALCEVMRLLVAGSGPVRGRSIAIQKAFFFKHVAPWYRRCLEDIQAAENADFYRSVAKFAQAFFAIEFEAFEIADAAAPHTMQAAAHEAPPDCFFEEEDHA